MFDSSTEDLLIYVGVIQQACRNPGMLEYRVTENAKFADNFCNKINLSQIIHKLSANMTKIVCKYDQNCLQI